MAEIKAALTSLTTDATDVQTKFMVILGILIVIGIAAGIAKLVGK